MLNEHELDWLVDQLAATSELLGQQMSDTAAAMLAEDLASYTRPVLFAALRRVRTEHTGKLTPKAILDRIDEVMGRPGSNEAWATALSALDERNTVIWTGEIAQAWAVASPIAKEGDLIGARMAFKDAYERLVRTARELRLLPVVTVSQGWDSLGRDLAIEKAVALGYMPPGDTLLHMNAEKCVQLGYVTAQEAVERKCMTKHAASLQENTGYSPVLLLQGIPPAALPRPIRERLLQLRADIAASDKTRHATAARDAMESAQALVAKKVEAQRLADEYMLAQDAEFRESQRPKMGKAA